MPCRAAVFAFCTATRMRALKRPCLVGGLVFFFPFGGLIALRGLACLTSGGGLSLAAAAAAALLFCFRAQAAVVQCSAAVSFILVLSNALVCYSHRSLSGPVHGPLPKSHQEQKGGEAMR